MQLTGHKWRRALLAGLGLSLAAAGGVSLAGEKVTFSDGDRGPRVRPEDPRKQKSERSLSIENPLEHFGRKSGSLDGVGAPPFAPTVVAPEAAAPLTDKERRLLDQRQNWIFRSTDDYSRDQNDAHRIFGVENLDRTSPDRRPEAGKGKLVDYFDRLSKSQEAANDALGEALRDSIRAGKDTTSGLRNSRFPSGAQPDGSLAPVQAMGLGGGFGTIEPGSPREAGFVNREGPSGLALDRSNSSDPDWLQPTRSSHPLLVMPSSSPNRLGEAPAPGGEELRGVSRILGSNPIGNPLSSLDPVTAYPDPTREALNPVVGRAMVKPVKPALGSSLAQDDSSANRTLQPGNRSSALLDRVPGLAQQSGFSPALDTTAPEKRSLHSLKLNLEMPRRSF